MRNSREDRGNGRLVDDLRENKCRNDPPAGLSYPTRVRGAVVGRLETVDLVRAISMMRQKSTEKQKDKP
jgi:hypothetical protein